MKFSLKAKRESRVELIGVTAKCFFGMAIPIAIKLNWEVTTITDDEVSFLTPFFFPTGGEMVSITIDGDFAIILSKNMGGFLPFELGRNTENIKLFLEGYASLLDLTKVNEFEHKFDEALKMWETKSLK